MICNMYVLHTYYISFYPPSLCVDRSGTGFYECMRPYATDVWGLKVLV
jgi:hypothetical protein